MVTPIVNNGIVLLLDALGVKSQSLDDAICFIERFESVINEVDSLLERYSVLAWTVIEQWRPKRYVFQDTLLFVWDLDNCALDTAGSFVNASYFASQLLKCGLEKGLLFRGAMSAGEYCYSANDNVTTIVGPAITDAASWYEEADWFGIIATPLCSMKIKCFLDKINRTISDNKEFLEGIDSFEYNEIEPQQLLVEYPIPLKNNRTFVLFTLSWPDLVLYEHKNRSLNWLYSSLARVKIAKGSESKYMHAIAFFEKQVNKIA